jgi:hypothetical protein
LDFRQPAFLESCLGLWPLRAAFKAHYLLPISVNFLPIQVKPRACSVVLFRQKSIQVARAVLRCPARSMAMKVSVQSQLARSGIVIIVHPALSPVRNQPSPRVQSHACGPAR